MHELMVEARVLEERLIKMYKQGDGYFWIGGPGEEAFNVPLGLLIKKGQGPDYDYLHLTIARAPPCSRWATSRSSAAADEEHGHRSVLAAAATSRATSPSRAWNVVPVSSPIEVQYRHGSGHGPGPEAARRRGHHHRHRRRRGHGRGRLRDCLVWSTRPGDELPVLMIVDQQPLGHLHPGRRPARREADRRPRQGVRHPERDHRRQRSRDGLAPSSRRRSTTSAPSASRTCSRRWCRGCTATRRPAARTS